MIKLSKFIIYTFIFNLHYTLFDKFQLKLGATMIYVLPVFIMCFTGYFLHRKLHTTPMSSFACVLSGGVLFVWFFAAFDLIVIGIALFYALCVILAICQIYLDTKSGKFHLLTQYFNISVILFLIACLIFSAIYAFQSPLFSYWDEYSYWGTAARQTHLTGSLPPVENFGLNTFSNLPTGSAVLGYLFSVFSSEYNDFSLYFSYIVVALAFFALVTEFSCKKAKNPFIQLSVFLFFVVSAFFQTYHIATPDHTFVSYVFGTAMVDFLLSIYLALSVILYLSNKDLSVKYFYFLPALLACITKDVGILFAILATCVIFCFEIFTSFKSIKVIIKRTLLFLLSFVLYFSIYYFAADIHTLHVSGNLPHQNISITANNLEQFQLDEIDEKESVNNADDIGAQEVVDAHVPASTSSLWLNIMLSVFSSDYRNAGQNEVISAMFSQFKEESTTFYINDTLLCAILIFSGAIFTFLVPKKYRTSLLMANIGVAVGAVLYVIAISFFIANFNDGMVEYTRYMTTYYWFWIYLVTALAFKVAIGFGRPYFITLLSILLTVFVFYIDLDETVINSPENNYAQAAEAKRDVDIYNDVLSSSPRILMIADRNNDYNYNLYRHRLLPAYVNVDMYNTGIDFSIGFVEKEYAGDENSTVFTIANDEEFLQIVTENFDYIFIAYPHIEFIQSYGEHFVNPLQQGKLYEVVNIDNTIYFEEVYADK